jgi:hypothetical protein
MPVQEFLARLLYFSTWQFALLHKGSGFRRRVNLWRNCETKRKLGASKSTRTNRSALLVMRSKTADRASTKAKRSEA